MKFTQFAAAAICAAAARADVVDDVKNAASDVSSSATSLAQSATSSVPKSTFTPTTLKAPFLEQFTDDWETRWKPSHAKKQTDGTTEEEWQFVGNWAVEEPAIYPGMVGDKGLVVKDKAAHHAISAKFAKPIDASSKPLVVQYEVKLQDGLECGGAYMKLLQDNAALKTDEFSNASPYVIMFGPDRCGATNKVHFIFKHKNPKTGEYEEKHLNSPPSARITKTTSHYQLVVHPNNTFFMNIDGEQLRTGSLLEDFTPSVNPEKEVDDAEDKKPEDWVEEARIADPEATKPEDWDEDAPYEILDMEAEMPEDWLENEPAMVPDPEAEKPEDWDDEEDGDWLAPMVPNPKGADVSGLGPWERPMMKNPAYKGKWSAPYIDNPAYKGIWKPRKIANPNYFEDKTPANFEPIGAIGFELWTMQNNILFDNIYIGHNVAEANQFREQTFDVKVKAEKADEDATKPKLDETPKPKSPMDLKFTDDPVHYVREKLDLFLTIAKNDPIQAIKFVPEIAGGLAAVAALTLAFIVMLVGGGGAAAVAAAPSKEQVKDAADKAGKKATELKDKAAEAVASGADKANAEVEKRKTRSQTAE